MKRTLLAILLFACAHAQAAVQRIVSLLPSITETVCVLGRCDALVAVDDYSNWPARVRDLPHVGGLDAVDVEKIVSLHPDIVLIARSSRAMAARLTSLGLHVESFEPKTLDDVHAALDRIGQLLGDPQRAGTEWARIEREIAAIAQSVPKSVRGTTVYVEMDAGPYAASESSHVGELLTRLGVRNIVPASLGSVPRLNPEFVVRADPQVIIVPAEDAATLPDRPGWRSIRAVRDGRVCVLSRAQGDVLVRPGPRLGEAAALLAACLQAKGTTR